MLQMRVHDSSRLEWITEIPIPEGTKAEDFDLEVNLEIPEHIWTPHDQWRRLQLMARFSSPNEDEVPANGIQIRSVDELRRLALAAARRAQGDQEAIEATILESSSLLADPDTNLCDDLLARIEQALVELRCARSSLGTPQPLDSPELGRERPLAAEFMSNQAIELIFRIEKAISSHLLEKRRPAAPAILADAERIRARLAVELAEELHFREERGLTSPNDSDPWVLERYVGRTNLVRRHFQGLLYLHVHTELFDTRYRALFAAAAATLGGLFVFPLALFLTGGFGVTGLSVGLTGSALLVGLTYGVRERIKDAARSWLANRVSESLGGRFATLTTNPRLQEEAVRVLRARESFHLSPARAMDPIHTDLGSSLPVERFRYQMKGSIEPVRHAAERGSEKVKMVFRYDLSPIFSRLDEPFKEVPVLAADGASLRFVEAARYYRIPVRLRLRHSGGTRIDEGILIAQKHGLERIERA